MTEADEKFFAWLDGELGEAEAAEVERRVAGDPALQDLAAAHRALGAQMRSAFDPVAQQAVPLSAYAPSENVASLAQARVARHIRLTPRFSAQAAAMAAVFVMGIVTGNMLLSDPAAPIAPEAGRLVASAGLEEALYDRLASQPAGGGPRIGLTFRDTSGAICRTFADNGADGLACREGGDWRLRALFQGEQSPAGDYRMAAGGDPRLGALVDEMIAGEPFDAAQEQAARDRGWQ
jgi:hypothetical protein